MSDPSSNPSPEQETGSRQRPYAPARPVQPLLLLAGGVGLVVLGAFVGERGDLRDRLGLDLQGERAEGEAEKRQDGSYRIRYTHPSGAIYARSYRSGLGLRSRPADDGRIPMRYDPGHPEHFQPAGVSLVPGALAGALFLAGMALVLNARRIFFRKTRLPDLNRPRGSP